MFKRKKLPKSIRRYIRREKAKIRRHFSDLKEEQEQIKSLYQKFAPDKKVNQPSQNQTKSQKNSLAKKIKKDYNKNVKPGKKSEGKNEK